MKVSATGNIYKIKRVANSNAPWQIISGETILSAHKSRGEAQRVVRACYKGDEAYKRAQ